MNMNPTPESILTDVRDAINSDTRFASTFEPFADGLHQVNEFWMVPVRLQRFEPVVRQMQIYAEFAELEDFLQAKKGLNVVLLPVLTSKIA